MNSRFFDIAYQGHVQQKDAYTCISPSGVIADWVNTYWQLDVLPGRFVYRSVPDNCIDWIINRHDPLDSFIVAPFSQAIEFPIEGPASFFGIRFKLTAYQNIVAAPVGEWQGEETNLASSQLISSLLMEQISQATTDHPSLQACADKVSAILLNALRPAKLDKRLENLAYAAASSNHLDINSFGVSARHLRRLSQLYFGLSIKEFLNVTRFQKTLHLMHTTNNASVWLTHYYDQSHFIREFKSMSGTSPKKFFTMSVLYNQPSH